MLLILKIIALVLTVYVHLPDQYSPDLTSMPVPT